MIPVFADTSFYLAIFNSKDQWHRKAIEWTQANDRPVVLTEFVLVELANAISRAETRSLFGEFVRALRNDPSVKVVEATSALFDRGTAVYIRRKDKNWSLTDCISFTVMKELGLSNALTADRHFEQAGFTVLLK